MRSDSLIREGRLQLLFMLFTHQRAFCVVRLCTFWHAFVERRLVGLKTAFSHRSHFLPHGEAFSKWQVADHFELGVECDMTIKRFAARDCRPSRLARLDKTLDRVEQQLLEAAIGLVEFKSTNLENASDVGKLVVVAAHCNQSTFVELLSHVHF